MSSDATDWVHLTTHPIHQTVTRIRFPREDGHATGFFYNSDNNTYLITNRHVVDREDGSSNPDEMRIFTRNLESLGQRTFHDISLSEGNGEAWFSPDPGIDIAAIPLEIDLDTVNHRIGIETEREPKTGSLAFNVDSILSEKSRVIAGDRTQIVGYPGQYIDRVYDFPVTRNAIVSTHYGLPYDGNPVFLTDARMHPGTSGSPVVAGPVTLITHGGIDLWGPAYKLLGVHSATLQQPVDEGDDRWLDLNTAWYAELVEALIREIETNGDSSK